MAREINVALYFVGSMFQKRKGSCCVIISLKAKGYRRESFLLDGLKYPRAGRLVEWAREFLDAAAQRPLIGRSCGAITLNKQGSKSAYSGTKFGL